MLYKKALFIFRRDLRLEDNTGLLFALENSLQVIPLFIFTPEQIEKNRYLSPHCLQFMIESLEELAHEVHKRKGALSFMWGEPHTCVEECIRMEKIDAVIVNRDYTPYSRNRDLKIENVCKGFNIPFHSFDDALLHPPEEVLKDNGKPYTLFTPYYKKALALPLPSPKTLSLTNFAHTPLPTSQDLLKKILPTRAPQPSGGRKSALDLLSQISAHTDTSFLSPHLKFTTCSIREAYHTICKAQTRGSDLIRSLFWRDFFTHTAYFFPHVFEGPYQKKYEKLPWNSDKKGFKRWCEGTTGFPLVDASMRMLNATGLLSNRLRMIVASFLIKDLRYDWRMGERYFATTLLDYDPAVNNGNWQWVASTGADHQPYFRIFNPWLQQKKYDPDCAFIKEWIPELCPYSPREIHSWKGSRDYPPPMLDHAKESAITIDLYKRILSTS